MIILDGFSVAKARNAELKKKIETSNIEAPNAVIILIGNNDASLVYVNSKMKAAKNVGISSKLVHLNENISESELEKIINDFNKDEAIDGILLQLPLPKHLDEKKFINLIDSNKDIDGFTIINQGKLFQGLNTITAATPRGIMNLIDHYNIELKGLNAVVIGRSQIVGLPISKLLLDRNATVTICHSRTKDLKAHTINADIIVVAVGIKHILKAEMVKKGVIVIDVGINREDGKLYGDADFDALKEVASYITPVPRGVGPMTINALLENIYELSKNKK